ncbi:menin-like isoform X2 [Gigantopelta aegis]|uniref:menin-like isoform X2 n=1 Tax=Gigantopelta aegis TaxID=1735272 RepID=UPI001B88DE39|nr:menin-like isoform X2 [Gigantopelta aegis]
MNSDGNKLDCFGVAFAVVAACQVLKINDVHLALSEDHAWVVFGKDGSQTAEVTWHGKGNEDKRGQPINMGVAEKSWLYLNGQPVVCSRQIEVAAMVSAINPTISATMDSVEMGSLQQELLWLLYDMGNLTRYPMALGNLGDLEEISKTPNRPQPIELFRESIKATEKYYNCQHVYPFTYLGGYLSRKRQYKGAIKAWADATAVVKKYNYNREDEEIYKEFLDIANEQIPKIVRDVSNECRKMDTTELPLLLDPGVYADILRFYDGICEWEEGSSTPVLHVGWAVKLVFSLSKFDPRVRSFLDVHVEGADENDSDVNSENGDDLNGKESAQSGTPSRRGRKKSKVVENIVNDLKDNTSLKTKVENGTCKDFCVNGKSPSEEEHIKSTIQDLVSKVGGDAKNDSPNPNIAALTEACGVSILNKDYLLGVGEPFTTAPTTTTTSTVTTSTATPEPRVDLNEFLSSQSNGTAFMGLTVETMLKAESPADMMLCRKETETRQAPDDDPDPAEHLFLNCNPVALKLHSAKMKGLKKLLTSSKLNSSAIKLQLTAQSQVHVKHGGGKRVSDVETSGGMRKRSRRE